MSALAWTVSVACFGFGVVAGLWIHYLLEYKPLRRQYTELVDAVLRMKKQGFVPQWDLDNTPKEHDPSKGIVEY